eukprot:CAMPEP_0206398610 /NCGR_PEP_ID=MMETSP0294-20121207/24272_2 /ASSEMBLY_ACC=CAM_ASM_000327 /TAXON_ID=39354 /ORGANISM="Heterosigma akashiwo, Strain CCMP2393" /LENGTH=92 /DNA_ID=CAMNT_0053854143 /DNA_START=131 /DNA_END=407 /DNA_ORIENTATION=-
MTWIYYFYVYNILLMITEPDSIVPAAVAFVASQPSPPAAAPCAAAAVDLAIVDAVFRDGQGDVLEPACAPADPRRVVPPPVHAVAVVPAQAA